MKLERLTLLMLGALLALRLVTMIWTPVFDPSEARYAAISANMARSGDFVVPHFTYDNRYQSFDGKPPLVFQMGGLACEVFGVNEFSVRLFPCLCAVLMCLVVYTVSRRFMSGDRAALATVMTGSMGAFYATAGFAMTDVPLAVSVASALLLYRAFAEKYEWRWALGVVIALGLGMIIKGPVSLALFGLPVLVDAIVNHRWKAIFNWKWLAVAPVYFLIAVPWFILVEQRNPGAVYYFFVNENFLRFVSHDYGDKYGAGRETFRGMAAIWSFVALLPWVLVPHKVNGRGFGLLATFAITGFWCLTSRVLVSYLLPVAPLYAVYLAHEVRADWVQPLMRRVAPWIVGILGIGLFIGMTIGSLVSDKMAGAASPYYPRQNRYSYEFYHGTPPEAQHE